MEFAELSLEEFKQCQFESRNFLQSAEMWRRYQDLGIESYLVGVKEGQNILAAGLITARPWRMGQKIFRVAGGWLMDYENAKSAEVLSLLTKMSKKFVQRRKGVVLEISPNFSVQNSKMNTKIVHFSTGGKMEMEPVAQGSELGKMLMKQGWKYLGEYGQAKWIFTLDLEGKTKEEIFQNFRQNHRNLIRRAEREGVRVRELKISELGILKEIAAESGRYHGFKEPDLEYFRSMKKAFGNQVKFMVAEVPVKSGSEDYLPLAAAMFVNDGREMVYLYSGSVRERQKYNGTYALQWAMIQEAIEAGCRRYNFYGTRPEKGNGVYLFKQGFRGQMEELVGTFALPINAIGKAYLARIKPREFGEIR